MNPHDKNNVVIEVFYDGACPLCRKDIAFIRKWDRKHRIVYTDIASASFDTKQVGKEMDELMAKIHGRLPDGHWVTGVDVFRKLYEAIGLRWLVSLTRLPGVSHALDWSYATFAQNRLRLTGRCNHGQCELP